MLRNCPGLKGGTRLAYPGESHVPCLLFWPLGRVGLFDPCSPVPRVFFRALGCLNTSSCTCAPDSSSSVFRTAVSSSFQKKGSFHGAVMLSFFCHVLDRVKRCLDASQSELCFFCSPLRCLLFWP